MYTGRGELYYRLQEPVCDVIPGQSSCAGLEASDQSELKHLKAVMRVLKKIDDRYKISFFIFFLFGIR